MPMRLDEGWNQIQFNLNDFTRRVYGTNYIETLRVIEAERLLCFGYLLSFTLKLVLCNRKSSSSTTKYASYRLRT
jgi:hypothetical protein